MRQHNIENKIWNVKLRHIRGFADTYCQHLFCWSGWKSVEKQFSLGSAGNVSTSHQKYTIFVATNIAGDCYEDSFKISRTFTLTNVESQSETVVIGLTALQYGRTHPPSPPPSDRKSSHKHVMWVCANVNMSIWHVKIWTYLSLPWTFDGSVCKVCFTLPIDQSINK